MCLSYEYVNGTLSLFFFRQHFVPETMFIIIRARTFTQSYSISLQYFWIFVIYLFSNRNYSSKLMPNDFFHI
jgi:hypothetical protein